MYKHINLTGFLCLFPLDNEWVLELITINR